MRAALVVVLATTISSSAFAQTKPATPKPPAPPPKPATQNQIRPRAFATFGAITFQAQESLDAIVGTHSGPLFGGGGQVLLPWGFYGEVGIWQFTRDGERAFVGPNREVFPLGIPVEVTVRPIEITGGWRYRHCPAPSPPPRVPQPAPKPGSPQTPRPTPAQPVRTAQPPARPCDPKFIPYASGGFSWVKYRETSDFSESSEDVEEVFNGVHIVGGAEYRVMKWIVVGGEVIWSSVADALGSGGVSAVFNDDNLGGTSVRLKITIGR